MFIERNIIVSQKGYAFQGVGVDTLYFKPIEKKKTDGKTIFAFMGRLIYEKGVAEFVEAARLLRTKYSNNVECWLIGGIDNENPSAVSAIDLLKWIEAKSIVYYGHIGDVRQVICETDCVVLPSYYPEGVPKVLQEAMSMNKPVITTDMPGCREAVQEGENGFLVKPRDVNSLMIAMEKIVQMTEKQRNQMGEKGRQKAILELDYSISNPIYLDIVTKAISSK